MLSCERVQQAIDVTPSQLQTRQNWNLILISCADTFQTAHMSPALVALAARGPVVRIISNAVTWQGRRCFQRYRCCYTRMNFFVTKLKSKGRARTQIAKQRKLRDEFFYDVRNAASACTHISTGRLQTVCPRTLTNFALHATSQQAT
jgi:hypothetical protein